MLFRVKARYRLRIPFRDGGSIISWLYDNGRVFSSEYDENAAILDVELYRDAAEKVQNYIVEVNPSGGFKPDS